MPSSTHRLLMNRLIRLFSFTVFGLALPCFGVLYEQRSNYIALNVAALLPNATAASAADPSNLVPYEVSDGAIVAALKSGGSFYAVLPAETFEVDERGLPSSPMLLQVCYFDGVSDSLPLVRAYSRLEFVSDDPRVFPDKREMHVATFRGTKSGAWRSGWQAFGKTPFQLIRAVDGAFRFRIENGGAALLPIAFVELRAINEEAYRWQLAPKRATIAYVPNPLDYSSEDLDESLTTDAGEDVFVFTRDIMRPVYKNTRPEPDESSEHLTAGGTLGEVKAVNLAFYSKTGIRGLSVAVGDLKNKAQRAVIPGGAVSVFRVVCDERRLSANTYSAYGLLPDRLEPFETVEVKAGESERIWFKIAIPEDAVGGDYNGTIVIGKDGQRLKDITVTLKVVPILLEPPYHLNPVYVDPFSKTYASKAQSVFAFLSEVGFDPFYILGADQAKIIFSANGEIADFNLSRFGQNLLTLKERGCLKRAMILEMPAWRAVYSAVHGISASPADPDLYLKLSDARFKSAFGLLVREARTIVRTVGSKAIFSLLDEPGTDPYKRIIADRLAEIIKENGGSTTVTYSYSCDRPVPVPSANGVPGGIIPPLTDLVDYKVWYYQDQGLGFKKNYAHFGYYTTFVSHLRNPAHNRFSHGIYAFATGARVVSAYALGDFIGDPYNDLDSYPEDAWPTSYPDFLMGYPSWDGRFISAMNAEGVREGITDARYLATALKFANSYPSHPSSGETLNFLASLKARISSDYWWEYYTGIRPDQLYRLYHPERIFKDVSETGDPWDFEAFTKFRSRLAAFLGEYLPSPPMLTLVSRHPNIVLGWQKQSTDNADTTKLVLERSVNEKFTPLAALSASSLAGEYEDKKVSEGRVYWYRLRSVNNVGSSCSKAIRVFVKD